MAIKSLVTASVLGVIGVAISATAFANTVNTSTFCKPGFYAGVQGGRSDTFYSPNSAMSAAAREGTGVTTVTTTNQTHGNHTGKTVDTTTYSTAITGAKTDDIGLGGRIYAGYQFNPYFALETGYTQFGKTSSHMTTVNSFTTGETFVPSDGSAPVVLHPTTPGGVYTTTKYSGEITEHAIDLMGKFTLPLQYGFGLDAKAGVAYIQADNHINGTVVKTVSGNTTITNPLGPVTVTTYTKTYQKFCPVAAVGVNYSIPNTNLSVTADYMRVFSYGGIPNAKLASVGLEYKFA